MAIDPVAERRAVPLARPGRLPELVVQLAFEAGNRLFDAAFRLSPTGDDATIDEARRLLTAYLETYKPRPSKAQDAVVAELDAQRSSPQRWKSRSNSM